MDGSCNMWAFESVFYQIFPLGLCDAPHENDGAVVPRIRRVAEWADYLEGLGVGAVLLNPVFESSVHGYDTRDLTRVDCRLGTNEELAYVVRALHARGIRVVLDAVFNHVGRDFWAFRDVRERRWDSPYKDWFCLNFDGDSAFGDGFWYEGWEGVYDLVKLNLKNPAVVDYLLDVVRTWRREFAIDGLRLDVASGGCDLCPHRRDASWRLQPACERGHARLLYQLRVLQGTLLELQQPEHV